MTPSRRGVLPLLILNEKSLNTFVSLAPRFGNQTWAFLQQFFYRPLVRCLMEVSKAHTICFFCSLAVLFYHLLMVHQAFYMIDLDDLF